MLQTSQNVHIHHNFLTFQLPSPFIVDYSHPNLPGAVTFDQLEVLAQVVVGAEAHFDDLRKSPVPAEL